MMAAPRIIGNEPVVIYSSIDHRHNRKGPAEGLAICQASQDGFYLFSCNREWNTRSDSWHVTLNDAMNQAEFEYPGVRLMWLNHDPAWVELNDADYESVWDLFCNRFRFIPSTKYVDWPGIVEPRGSVTFDISEFLDGSESAKAAADDLDVEMFGLLRLCVRPGDTLFALDWHHPAYRFNPYGQFEFSVFSNSMVPVVPNGDYYIFLAEGLRFGLFGHPWEQTVCVFGQPLLDIVMQERPKLLKKVIRRDGVIGYPQ